MGTAMCLFFQVSVSLPVISGACLGWSENFSVLSVEDDVSVWIFCLDHWFKSHTHGEFHPQISTTGLYW